MIPLQLELTNFLSYRKTAVLNFDGVHLACISGLNGAGKSTLLDAITWALFGKSRSRSDDDIINRLAVRQNEAAEVRFVFDLEGTIYRVIRQKPHGRTPVLEFQIAVGDDSWRTMSEGGVRQTQAAIENMLRMNFDTFINASFFLQGQADEFTTKTPGKRKEILADLLSVNLWDRYKEAATKRRKQEENTLVLLDARLNEIEGELGEQPQREADLKAAQEELAQASERLREKEKLLEQMRRVEAAIKQQKQQVQNLRESLTRAETRLKRLRETQEQREKERAEYQKLLDEAQAIVAEHEAWQKAEAELACWQEKAEKYNELQQERRPHELALERARSTLQQREKELERQRQRVAKMSDEQKQLEEALKERRATLAELATQLERLAQKEEDWHAARAELQQLDAERQLRRQELAKLRAEAQRMTERQQEQGTVQKNLAEAEKGLAAAEAEVVIIRQKHDQLMQCLAERDALQREQQRLRDSMSKLNERRQRLSSETGGTCPLCGQSLTEEHRQTVLAEVQLDGEEQAERFRSNKQRLEGLESDRKALEQKIKERDRWQREEEAQRQRKAKAQARIEEIERALTAWKEDGSARIPPLEEALEDDSEINSKQVQVAALGRDVQQKKTLEETQREQQKQASADEARQAEIERAIEEWQSHGKAELASVLECLEKNKYALEARAALETLDVHMKELAYDSEAHNAARVAREQLSGAPARYQELKQAEAAVKPLEDTLADLKQQLEEQDEVVAHVRQQHEEAVAQLETLASDDGDLIQVEKEVTDLREQEVVANRRVGAAQQRLDVLDDLRKKCKEETARRAELTRLIERLQRLEKACGRDGVQALLIEQALPEIEEDANDLLERLTGGEMRVTFETQRELKSRDALAETLDIRISDVAGERPYENFSGGEQFRVNFAIRLALSRILAKRAGARLQTLVIDEGFGSQDPEGRQRLVEAINTIKTDFARILIITHIGELRDAFPTRIEVEKTPGGSQVVVV